MGAWGPALFSDDLAADIREDFRDCVGDGLGVDEAVEKLKAEYLDPLPADDGERSVFWLALAMSQWKLGRVHEPTRQEALRVIDSGADLVRWEEARDRAKRKAVLEKVAEQLRSPAPPARKVPRRHREASSWNVGEVCALQLASGSWTLLRVIGHAEDKAGRYAIVEFLNWVGTTIPSPREVDEMDFRVARPPHQHISQFFLLLPRRKKDQARLRELGFQSRPRQTVGGFSGLDWLTMDKWLKEFFELQ